jgi:hypothetical protein
MKIKLGFKPKYWNGADAVEAKKDKPEKKEPPTCYPQMTIQGDAADKLTEKADADDYITATVKMRVVGISSKAARASEYDGDLYPEGASVDLEIISMDNVEIEGEKGEEKEADASDAIDGYMQEKGIKAKK